MTYVTKSCPHCNSVYIRHQTKGRFIGSPFRVCNKCGKKFIDKDFVEIAFLPPSEYEVAKVTPGSIGIIVFGFFGMAVSLCLVGSGDWSFYLLFFAAIALLGVICAIGDTKDYASRKFSMDRELEASKARVSNPEYIAALANIGVKVPPDFRKRVTSPEPTLASLPGKGRVASPEQKTPAYYTGWFPWHFVELYIKEVDSHIDRKQHMQLWSACFYAITKAISDQRFIDEAYSHFATFAIRRVYDPRNRAYVVDEMRNDYRAMRPLLNSCQIMPCGEEGARQLWLLLVPIIYPNSDPPTQAEAFFVSNLMKAQKLALQQYRIASKGAPTIRYSISASPDICILPEESK